MKPSAYIKFKSEDLQELVEQNLIGKEIDVSRNLDSSKKYDYAFVELDNNSIEELQSIAAACGKVIIVVDESLKKRIVNRPTNVKFIFTKTSDTSGLELKDFSLEIANKLFGFFNTEDEHYALKQPAVIANGVKQSNESIPVERLPRRDNPVELVPRHGAGTPRNDNTAALPTSEPSSKISYFKIFLIALSALSLPFLVYAISVISLYAAVFSIGRSPVVATYLFKASSATASLFGTVASADLIADISSAGARTLSISQNLSKIDNKNFEEKINNLSLELNALYKEVSFLETKLAYSKSPFGEVLGSTFTNETRELVLTAQSVTKTLPQLFGDDWDEEYLLLFQDESVIRPTGGKINYLTQFTLREGKVVYTKSYTADELSGKINGKVDPPFDYPDGEGDQWEFSDINWEVSFNETAEYAKWFLDKALDAEVEHVFLVKEAAAKDISEYLEVSNNSSEISKAILKSLFNAGFSSVLKTNLDNKNILFSSSSKIVSELIENQNWGGNAIDRTCFGSNCLDLSSKFYQFQTSGGVAVLEHSLNSVLTRNNSKLEIKHEIIITNNDNAPYKGFFTFAWNKPGELQKVNGLYKRNAIASDYRYYRQALDLQAGESLTLNLEIDYPNYDSLTKLNVLFDIQEGVGSVPFAFNFINEKLGLVYTKPHMSLTDDGSLLYTTSLDKAKAFEILVE